MKKIIFLLFMMAADSYAGEWVNLTPENAGIIQAVQANNSAGQPEGLYIGFKTSFTLSSASNCSRRDFVVITDPKLVDRTLSTMLFAIATKKTVSFYVDGQNQCAFNGPIATIMTLYP